MSSSIQWPCAALQEAELSSRTTLHVGGQAECLLEPAHPDELRKAWVRAREEGLMPRILGGGANLIIESGVHPGVTIATGCMRRIFRPDPRVETENPLEEEGQEGLPHMEVKDRNRDPRLVAWCGASLPGLVRTAAELGWSGLEGLVGVPGHVGGGVAMNAGGRWGEIWDVIESVRVLNTDGELEDLLRADCDPKYRDGNLGGRMVVGAVLRLEVETKAVVRERMREYLSEKNKVQPVTQWSAGCIFKNPDPEASEGRSAGKLVDDCGGKGLRRGGAVVSPLHGNFIVNEGTATATDVLTLIEDVRDRVAQKTGIWLEQEVKAWRLEER